MTRKEIIKKIKKGELKEEEYSKITPSILSSLTKKQINSLNPNYLYHINRQTILGIDDKTFNILYELSLQSTLEKVITRRTLNYSGRHEKKYRKNINSYYLSTMAETRFTIRYNQNHSDEVNQEFCKESGLISSQDVYKLLNINFSSRKKIEESGLLKRVMGENNGGSSVYYDYNYFLEKMNDFFCRAERDMISPAKFDSIPKLLKKKDIKEKYGNEYFVAIANFVNQIFDYISYFKISERMIFYPEYIVEAVKPIVEFNLEERRKGKARNKKYDEKEYRKRDKLMLKEFEKKKKKNG